MISTIEVDRMALKRKNNWKTAPTRFESEKRVDANVFAQRVEKKAYELYQKRGCQDGNDWNDWFEAEKEVEAEMIAGQ
ncbi:MAG: DUF2934 domain-containing protein [Candidatus Omnitrophica bacterium]|nr:DUF2934 domain-containing protein [Candidatus Omnitrophota bacterium]